MEPSPTTRTLSPIVGAACGCPPAKPPILITCNLHLHEENLFYMITCFEFRFSLSVWASAMKSVPFIWISVITLVLLTYKPAEWLTSKIVAREDSFRAQIVVNILCTVLLMSVFLTVIGTWIGTGHISM